MLSRRAVLVSPLAVLAARPAFAQGKMTLAIHQNTSAGAGYRNCYHFWSGNNKLEDLDLLRSGEVGHVHFQDVPDIPREPVGCANSAHAATLYPLVCTLRKSRRARNT